MQILLTTACSLHGVLTIIIILGLVAWLFSTFIWVKRLDDWAYSTRLGNYLPYGRMLRGAKTVAETSRGTPRP